MSKLTSTISEPTPTADRREQAPHWRNVNAEDTNGVEGAVLGGSGAAANEHDEFPAGGAELRLDPVGRRDFLGVMGASMALAGVGMGGCVRKPREKILPYTKRPEDLVPGNPRYYATSAQVAGSVIGLLVESQDGRPTKIEGNPRHPMNGGSADTHTQASILDLYDPQRMRRPHIGGDDISLADMEGKLSKVVANLKRADGAGLALLVQDQRSPTLMAMLEQVKRTYPGAKLYLYDETHPRNGLAGAAAIGIDGVRALYELDRADRVLAVDADFLGVEGDVVRNAKLWARGRRVTSQVDTPSRLYVVEPTFTITGMNADNRLRMAPSQIVDFLADLATYLIAKGAPLPEGAQAVAATLDIEERKLPSATSKWVQAVGRDLLANRGRSLVIVGERQPPRAHALGHLVNAMLDSLGSTIKLVADIKRPAPMGTLEQLVRDIKARRVQTLVILGGNPVFEAPADLKLDTAISNVPISLCLVPFANETAVACGWAIPQSHFLEAWGDLRATDGTFSLQQPLIAPLYQSLSAIELIARLLGTQMRDGYSLVRHHWATNHAGASDFEQLWRRSLHDGVKLQHEPAPAVQYRWDRLPDMMKPRASSPTPESLELVFQLDSNVLDGRFATNAWMQELPDPVTKLTWDNALLVGPATAKRLGIASEDIFDVDSGAHHLQVATWVTPGVAENCLVLSLGYGHALGQPVVRNRGFNANILRPSYSPAFVRGVKLSKHRGHYKLASTQDHGTMVEPLTGRHRPVALEATLEEYQKDPHFVHAAQLLPGKEIQTQLWDPPNGKDGPQWGMAIDLGTCTGCNACTIACQAENNISVVGKERVLNGREMHWIRLDRYFVGDANDPHIISQPMACAHCETAPCESVCPVAATVHSPEGLNDMVYNRCIGTRYCSNNCPYKVRRFNFFNYGKENDKQTPMLAMQRNPDVTVRFRGVMEKCTYCVQRINEVKIAAKVSDREKIPDGQIVPACQQTCPAEAIVFGDVNDPDSKVSRVKQQNRNYAVLADLNLQPRTTYLARIRNPHPDLQDPPPQSRARHGQLNPGERDSREGAEHGGKQG